MCNCLISVITNTGLHFFSNFDFSVFDSIDAIMDVHPNKLRMIMKLVAEIHKYEGQLPLYEHRIYVGPWERARSTRIQTKKNTLIRELKEAVKDWSFIPRPIMGILLKSKCLN